MLVVTFYFTVSSHIDQKKFKCLCKATNYILIIEIWSYGTFLLIFLIWKIIKHQNKKAMMLVFKYKHIVVLLIKLKILKEQTFSVLLFGHFWNSWRIVLIGSSFWEGRDCFLKFVKQEHTDWYFILKKVSLTLIFLGD